MLLDIHFFYVIPIINERVSISFLVSTEKNHWGTTWCCEMCQIFKITRGDFGEIISANENNELYEGLLSFMIVGLKENVPYIIKSVLERNIDGKWIKSKY